MRNLFRKGTVMVGAIAALAVLAPGAVVSVAQATPSPSSLVTYHFTDCVGPAGTPTTFAAVKHPNSSAALRLVGGEGTFVAVQAQDALGTILFSTPGFGHNAVATITCQVINPLTQQDEIVSGFIA